jgi:hypothetical protein
MASQNPKLKSSHSASGSQASSVSKERLLASKTVKKLWKSSKSSLSLKSWVQSELRKGDPSLVLRAWAASKKLL